MTRDELIALAKEAGSHKSVLTEATCFLPEELERFAELVAAKEREKMLDELRLLADDEGRVTLARKP